MLLKTFAFKLIIFSFISKLNFISGFDRKTDCGCDRFIENNIMNGKKSAINSLPWMASITSDRKNELSSVNKKFKIDDSECSGFIINEKFVMTAKYCTANGDLTYSVGFGTDKVKMYDEGKLKVIKVIPHPIYDVSLLELEKKIDFKKYRPACIDTGYYKGNEGYAGLMLRTEDLLAAGYGKKSGYRKRKSNDQFEYLQAETDDKYLKEAVVEDVSGEKKTCKNDESKLCVINSEKKIQVSRGDGGGPLHYTIEGKTFVIGLLEQIMNHEKPGDDYDYYCVVNGPEVYRRTESFVNFIEEHVGKEYCDDSSISNLRKRIKKK